MDIDLSNKVAAVTGGTTGIGLSIAETFAATGAEIAICSSNQTNVAEALNYLSGKDVNAYGEVVDVSQRSGIFSLRLCFIYHRNMR